MATSDGSDMNYETVEEVYRVDAVTVSILRALSEGYGGRAVADRCNVSERTFRRRMQQLRRRWGVDTNVEAVVHAVRAGLI